MEMVMEMDAEEDPLYRRLLYLINDKLFVEMAEACTGELHHQLMIF